MDHHSIEINHEYSVLGAIILQPARLDEVRPILRPDDFRMDDHKKIYAAMLAVAGRNAPLDALVLRDESGVSLEVIVALADMAPDSAQAEWYAHRVREHSINRQIKTHVMAAATAITDGQNPSDIAIDLQKQIDDDRANDLFSTGMDFRDLLRKYDQPDATQQEIKTGYDRLDRMHNGGLSAGEVTILAAAPSIGKSQLAINLLCKMHVAGKPARVLFASQEMSYDLVYERVAGAISGVPLSVARTMRRGIASDRIMDSHGEKYVNAKREMYERLNDSVVYSNGCISADDFRGLAAKYRHKADVIILDYLQLCRSTTRGQSKRETIEEMSQACKDVAVKSGVHVIAISSLNREGYREAGTRPTLAHLKECGDIEYDADNVWMLWREKDENAPVENMELLIRKQRSGPLAFLTFQFNTVTGQINDTRDFAPSGQEGF